MKLVFSRRGAAAAALLSVLAVGACQAPAPPAPPPVAAYQLPSPTLSASVVEAAGAYQTYVRDAAAISSAFTDAETIQSSLRRGASYEPKQFSRGAVAYGAVAALQSPEYVAGVRGLASDASRRQLIINQIMADPAYAAQLPGAENAAGLIVSALSADGSAVHRAGTAVKQAAYDVQKQKWSREHVKNRDQRLALAKQLSATPITASNDDSTRLMQAALSGGGLSVTPGAARPPYTQTVTRGLAIAALTALGAGDEAGVDSLLEEKTGAYCLNLAKLNLYQCLAVSKPHYEDVFCLGQHVLMDTGQCLTKVAGSGQATFSPIPTAEPAAIDAATRSTPASATASPAGAARK